MKTRNTKRKIRITFTIVGLVMAIVMTLAVSTQAATWTQKADMPTARWGISTNVVDGKIYAIGGVNSSKKVEEYDPATDTWTRKADMPTSRAFHASSVVDGKIYVIGGSTAWNTGTMLTTVDVYDPVTDTWTQKADTHTARNALATSVVNGKIYAIGGADYGSELSTVEEYDPATDTWTIKADMPTARQFVATNVVDGKIYAFGGVPEIAWDAFSTVEVYDPATDTWAKRAEMPAIRSFGVSTAVLDDKIYAFGGNSRRGGPPLSAVFRYDPMTDTWTEEDNLPVQMLGMGVSTVGSKIYIIGGTSASYPYNVHLSTVWEYDTGLGVPSPDFNGDGIVDSRDVSIMVNHWHTNSELYDIAPLPFGDDFVDVQDLVALSEFLFEEVNDPALIAHWPLDEIEGDIASDSAGENIGFVMGGAVWQPDAGQVNGAIQLDGVDDVIIAGSPLDSADDPFSVLAWVKGGAPGQVVISESAGSNWLSADSLEGCLMTELRYIGGRVIQPPLLSQAVITDGQWHRIGFVWDGAYRALYVDDTLVAEDSQPGLAGFLGGLNIGCGSDSAAGTFWAGLIDDVRIYDRALRP